MLPYFVLLLCCHLVGDYYLQGRALVQHKQAKASGVVVHSLLYGIAYLPVVVGLKGGWEEKGLFLLTLFVSHLVVDMVSRKHPSFAAFLVDQAIHLSVLAAMVILFPLAVELSSSLIGIGFALLFIFKPSSVVVSKMLASCTATKGEMEQEALHAGRKIGYLERLIILLLGLFGAISTCALVIAAKTLVRYSEFSSDNNFREVFLVGTLMSITLALIGYGVARILMG